MLCVIQQVLISYVFYTLWYIYVNPSLPVHPASLPLLLSIHVSSMSVSLFLLCKKIHVYHFSKFHICVCVC